MNKINIKVMSSILLVGLLSGCASKNENVVYDEQNAGQSTVKLNTEHYLDNVERVDKKVTQIKSNSMKVSTIAENTTKKRDSYINEVVSVIDGKSIILSSVHFGFDQYKLTPEMTKIVNNNSVKINNVYSSNKNVKIKLEGNCDEWGTDEYNYALGLKRTKTVKNALVKSGISSDGIVVVSFGESNPLCAEQTAKCWKQNRRVDYKLLP